MKYLAINALDTLFFRDGRPFTMGDDSAGFSLFPPPPTVFRGYLRTAFFGENGGDVTAANSPSDPTAQTGITHFSLVLSEKENEKVSHKLLFPLPADIVLKKEINGKKNHLIFLDLKKNTLPASSSEMPYLLTSKGNQKLEEAGGKIWLTETELLSYLRGDNVSHITDLRNHLTDEPKTGIGRDNATRTAADTGNLYQIHMTRPENREGKRIGFGIGFEGLDMKNALGLGRLGGESKLTYCEFRETEWRVPKLSVDKEKYAKMYLTTPAIFREGWHPETLFRDFGVEVLAAAVGRYQSYGGWDMAQRGPKPMYRAVPSGSVYYLGQRSGGRLKELINQFHGRALNHPGSIPIGYDKEGFGIVWFGALQKQAINELNGKRHVPAS